VWQGCLVTCSLEIPWLRAGLLIKSGCADRDEPVADRGRSAAPARCCRDRRGEALRVDPGRWHQHPWARTPDAAATLGRVQWEWTVPSAQGFWARNFFSRRMTVTELRDPETSRKICEHAGISFDESDVAELKIFNFGGYGSGGRGASGCARIMRYPDGSGGQEAAAGPSSHCAQAAG
jgi:hypothetical protein